MPAREARGLRRETGLPRVPRLFCPRPCRGAVLLEVLISLGLLVFGLAVVGLRVVTSLDTARRTDLWTRGMVLADIKLAELDAGVVRFKATDDQLKGYFGIDYPGYTWRIEVEPTDTDELFMLTLEIGYNGNPLLIERQKNDPTFEIDIEDEGTIIIRTVYRLMPVPADLDLNRDFGIDLEELQAGGDLGGGGGPPGGEGDVGGEAASLWNLVMEFLTAHPEILNDNGGIDLNAVADLPPEDFQLAMQILNQFVGRGANFGSLQDQLDQELGGGEDRDGQGRGGRDRGGIGGGQDRGGVGPGGDRGGAGEGRGGGRRGEGRGGEPGGDRGPGDTGGSRRFGGGRDRNNDAGPNDGGPDDRGPDDRGFDDRPPNDRRSRDRNSNDNNVNDRRGRDRNADDRNNDDRNFGTRGNTQDLRERLRQQREGRQGAGR